MLHLAAIILCSISLFLQLFCLVTPYWMYVDTGDDDKDDDVPMIYVGLWQRCFTKSFRDGKQRVCVSIDYIPNSLQWTRFAETVGMALIAAALSCGMLKHFVFKNHDRLLKPGMSCGVSAGCLMLAGIFSLVGESDNGQLFDYMDLKFHACFGFCIVAAVIAFAAGAMFFLWERKDSNERVQKSQDTVEPMSMGAVQGELS